MVSFLKLMLILIDCKGGIAVVHNGVITNYRKLKEQLIKEGHRFLSETDTEVIPHMLEKYYQGDIEKATLAALEKIEGSYAIVVLTADENKEEELVLPIVPFGGAEVSIGRTFELEFCLNS
jgi:glucosamine 6-phosphate synthetase-like amidotransferase/phosphosugar isomerase protein